MNTHPIVIFDIDGTLADISHRLHHVKSPNKNWAAFNAKVSDDAPVLPLIRLGQHLNSKYTIILVSGRGEEVREATKRWLEDHKMPYQHLFMRPAGDYRKDTIIKREILDKIRKEFPVYSIEFVIDDRQSVVDMWREQGLICLQCAAWDEEDTTFKPAQRGLLTLMVGPSGAGKSAWLGKGTGTKPVGPYNISDAEIISSDDLRHQICGDFKDQSKNPQVFSALYAIAKARIDNGLNAVIDATNIKRADRLAIISHTRPHATRYIVIDRPLEEKYATAGWRDPALLGGFDLIAKHHSTFTSQLKDILKGDNLPNVEVIDLRKGNK